MTNQTRPPEALTIRKDKVMADKQQEVKRYELQRAAREWRVEWVPKNFTMAGSDIVKRYYAPDEVDKLLVAYTEAVRGEVERLKHEKFDAQLLACHVDDAMARAGKAEAEVERLTAERDSAGSRERALREALERLAAAWDCEGGTKMLQALYDSEINFSISTLWDAGFDWALGDELNGFVAEGQQRKLSAAIAELCSVAVKRYPTSEFSKKYPSVSPAATESSTQEDLAAARKAREAAESESRSLRDALELMTTERDEKARQLGNATANYESVHKQLAEKIAWERDGYWRWQGDDTDHIETLTCHVVIGPEQLRSILSKSEDIARQRDAEWERRKTAEAKLLDFEASIGERQRIFKKIDSIRNEQDAKWPRDDRRRAMYAFIPPHALLLEENVVKLRGEWYASKPDACASRFETIAAIAVRALEETALTPAASSPATEDALAAARKE
jgi:hypothetical protein